MEQVDFLEGNSPVIVTAIHDGHRIRRELAPYMNLSEHDRMREEDPYTDYLTEISDTRIVVRKSRFEVDLNRPRDKAVYLQPEDAWGLNVWKEPLPSSLLAESHAFYDKFYNQLREYLHGIIHRHGRFLVLDIHTYNYRRETPQQESSALMNPEINIGTGSLPSTWRTISDQLIHFLKAQTINGHTPDVRENVNFMGGYFSRWINENFGVSGCALAIEIKKTFMDEWTGRVDIHHLNSIRQLFKSAIPGLADQIEPITQRYG